MLNDPIIAIIRTLVPSAVGAAIAWGAAKGIGIDEETSATLTTALVAICTALYYAAVTWLERKIDPAFGWLLGVPKAPSYNGVINDHTGSHDDQGGNS